jgi:hypothetical protein
MKHILMVMTLAMLFAACEKKQDTAAQATEETAPLVVNQLSEDEKAAGWQLLFDGQTTQGWHTYLKEEVEGWQVVNGELMTTGGHGDIVTDAEYENFELSLEWRVAPKGNSGIFYKVMEDAQFATTYVTGPEYQLIDDNDYPYPLDPRQKSGANYDLEAPSELAAHAPGTFNLARIVVNGPKVEHWLNGKLVVSYEIGSETWNAQLQNSKFKAMPGYAKAQAGRIALQDHGDEVAFRNVKIKVLP